MKSKKLLLIVITAVVFVCVFSTAVVLVLVMDGKDEHEADLQEFFQTSSKSWTFEHESISDPENKTETGTVWVYQDKFKIEYNESNGTKRWLLSPNGESVYYCYEDTQHCIVGVAPVEHYQMRWEKPAETYQDLGRDSEWDCQLSKYPVDREYRVAGAGNGWYVDYITYCSQDDNIVYREQSGGQISLQDDSRDTAQLTRQYLSEIDTSTDNSAIDFALPYPLKED